MLMAVQAIDDKSPHLAAVKELWKANCTTLGFFPDGAFLDYARDKRILVALDGDKCVGYTLYRLGSDVATIAHFCIAADARKQGHAKALIKELSERTKHLRGISLYCRSDFEANKSWPRLGFQRVGSKRGRAASGSELICWFLDHGHPDMFEGAHPPTEIEAAMDANIFLDLVEDRSEETKGLRADWLRPLVTLCYTAELINEVNSRASANRRKQRTKELEEFKELRCSSDAFQHGEAILRPLFPSLANDQDESDFRHLVRALACNADVFITRDGDILAQADEIYTACQLSVVRPSEFIARLDVLEREKDYQRAFIAGTRVVSQERLSSIHTDLLQSITAHGERQKDLARELQRMFADPRNCQTQCLTNGNEILAVFSVEQDNDIDRVPLLRIIAERKVGTVARAVLTGIIRRAVEANRRAVFLTDSRVTQQVIAAVNDLGFLPVNGGRVKLILRGLLSTDEAATAISWDDPNIATMRNAIPQARTNPIMASQIEHLLWPAKLADSALPSFIVPIRPFFAEHLFDERLARGGVLGADPDLALNPESAYYRAARPPVLTHPSRVLWYVSEEEKYDGSKTLRACSRITEVVTGCPKALYQRYKRLGVYEWSHVLATAKGDLKRIIQAFRFDDSELLRPLRWNEFQTILENHGKRSPLASPVGVCPAAFAEIYAAAINTS